MSNKIGWLLAVGAAAAAMACRLEAKLSGEGLACADGICPTGLTCVVEVCEVSGAADAGVAPSGDGAPGDVVDGGLAPDAALADAGEAGACNPMSLLADDFGAATFGSQWNVPFANGGAASALVAGRLRVTVPSGGSGAAYSGLASRRYFDLTGSHISVAVPTMVSLNGHAQALMQLVSATAPGDRLAFEQQNGGLRLQVFHGAMQSTTTVPYDPVTMRHWQLRESGGLVIYETSPDGVSWTAHLSTEAPFSLSLVRVELLAGRFQPEEAPGIAEFDDVNAGVATGSHCKTATLSDDFEDGVPDARWAGAFAASGCSVSESGGELVVAPLASAVASSCGYRSSAAFDLTDSHVDVEVAEMVSTASSAFAFVRLADEPPTHGVELRQAGGFLSCTTWQGATESIVDRVVWDPVAQRHWRLAEAGGQLRWETSPDGVAWTTRCTTATAVVDVDDVEVSIGAGTDGSGGRAPGRLRLESLNRSP